MDGWCRRRGGDERDMRNEGRERVLRAEDEEDSRGTGGVEGGEQLGEKGAGIGVESGCA